MMVQLGFQFKVLNGPDSQGSKLAPDYGQGSESSPLQDLDNSSSQSDSVSAMPESTHPIRVWIWIWIWIVSKLELKFGLKS